MMHAQERAEFQEWLRGLTLDQLSGVESMVRSMINAKKASALRNILPGMVVEYQDKSGNSKAGIVDKIHRVSILVHPMGEHRREKVTVEQITAYGNLRNGLETMNPVEEDPDETERPYPEAPEGPGAFDPQPGDMVDE